MPLKDIVARRAYAKLWYARPENRERTKKKARAYKAKPMKHGTYSSYVKWKCRCEACQEANRVYHREWWRKNKGITLEQIKAKREAAEAKRQGAMEAKRKRVEMLERKRVEKEYKSAYYAAHREEILAEDRRHRLANKVVTEPKPDHNKFLQWRLSHLRMCGDYPGLCCMKCHKQPVLWFVRVGDATNYLCCAKRIANKVGYGDATNSDYDAQQRHGFDRRVAAQRHDAKEIAKLPNGLLKRYLTQKVKE